MKVRIAMSGLFGALFFLLLPVYNILLQQNTLVHPILRIISILLLISAIILTVFTSKKFAYLAHDHILSQKDNQIILFLESERRVFHLMSIGSIVLFILFLLVKITLLNSMTFFFQSRFGTIISLILSTLFLTSLFWSAFILIQNHLEETYPTTFVSPWGKLSVKIQTDSHETMNEQNTPSG